MYEALDEAQGEINKCKERIEDLEEEAVMMKAEVFGLQWFAGSDSDIILSFYTGLTSYTILLCVFRFIEPLLSSVLSRTFGLGRKLRDVLAPSRVGRSGGILPWKNFEFYIARDAI